MLNGERIIETGECNIIRGKKTKPEITESG
jgi:hypothetical protein